jgi:hypothetical protein
MKKITNSFLFFILSFLSVSILTGCDQARQKLSDLLSPPSPIECVIRVQRLIDTSDFQNAITLGEDYLKDKNLSSDALHLAVAKAYLELGDSAKALEHTSAANHAASMKSKTNDSNSEQTQKIEAGDASVTETSKGTVLKAGDATVILPK